MQNDNFAEVVESIEKNENTSGLKEGDTCPDCDRKLHKLTHERDSQLDTKRHKDAPETEIVCRAHDIQEQF